MKFIVRLVNPRFLSFNRPLLLASTVGCLTFLGFVCMTLLGLGVGFYGAFSVGSDDFTTKIDYEHPLVSGPARVLERHVEFPKAQVYNDDFTNLEHHLFTSMQSYDLVDTTCNYTSCVMMAWDTSGDRCSLHVDEENWPRKWSRSGSRALKTYSTIARKAVS